VLPSDLRSAEAESLCALQSALDATAEGGTASRWTIEFRFQGLKILPLALRFGAALQEQGLPMRLLFTDAGATALAKRDAPDLAGSIASLGDQIRLQKAADPEAEPGAELVTELLVLVAPALAEYEDVDTICQQHRGAVLLLNGNLEDAAIGIGSVARQRRRGFLSTWSCAYALIPLAEAALRRSFPDPWGLYRRDADGYRWVANFEQKPDAELQAEALKPGQTPSMADGLKALDRFLGSLSN